ncbi:hypothetical protein HRbin01_01725 [archaeon HR01]|nr:hypothetical protein HRbin01_01725 [archaeon HR01]
MSDEILKALSAKVDELKEFLEDVFLNTEEYLMVREVDKLVAERRFNELVSLDEL